MPGSSTSTDRFRGFVHVADGELVDGSGNILRLRGVGLGNWLLPEGYMWKFEPGGPLSPRQIESFICGLVGQQRSDEFWREFRERYITEDDVARMAAEGFDHVRVAINSRIVLTENGDLIEDGFALIDRLINWCRAHGLWVVLDLHGAPGGQTGTNIDDSPHGLPELFTDDNYLRLTIDLWRAIATRYRDETVVAGYDLLNEPLPNEYQHLYVNELASLYKEITAAIREIDENHVIIYEGTHWSNNWSLFTEVWDLNSMLQCHKYWNPPDRASVRQYVEKAAAFGLPVYMGETGENNLDWMQTAFQLYEDSGMSWNLWPWKKIDTVTSPCSVDPPDGWTALVEYARGVTDVRPTSEQAWTVLCDLLERLDLSRCTYRQDVVNAVMRRAPLRIPASGFGFRGPGLSYQTSGATPLPGYRRDDQVSLECDNLDADGAPTFGHNHGQPRLPQDEIVVRLAPHDWVAYEVELTSASVVDIVVAADLGRAPSRVPLAISFADERLADVAVRDGFVVGSTGAKAGAGRHHLKVEAGPNPVVVRWIDVAVRA